MLTLLFAGKKTLLRTLVFSFAFWAVFGLSFAMLSLVSPTSLQAQVCGDAFLDAGEACDEGITGVATTFEDPLIVSPNDIYLDEAGGYLYVVNNGAAIPDNFISRINLVDGSVEPFIDQTDGANYFLLGPNRILQDTAGNFYLSDVTTHRIYLFDETGSFVAQTGIINFARGLLFHPDGRLLISTVQTDEIFSLDLADFSVSPAPLIPFADDDQINGMQMVFGPEGDLLIANFTSNSISRFVLNGGGTADSAGLFATSGPGDAELSGSANLAVNTTNDQVCVTNFFLDNVICFDALGAFTGLLLDSTILGETIDGPDGIDFDEDGQIWLASNGNDRVYYYIVEGHNADAPNACRLDCTLPICGDGIVDNEFGEECDDGNNTDGDGCSATCQLEVPGETPPAEGPDGDTRPDGGNLATLDPVAGSGGCQLGSVATNSSAMVWLASLSLFAAVAFRFRRDKS